MNDQFRSGCVACPAQKFCTASYRGSFCAAQRAKLDVDFDPATLADAVRCMNDQELKNFLLAFLQTCGCARLDDDCLLAALQSPLKRRTPVEVLSAFVQTSQKEKEC